MKILFATDGSEHSKGAAQFLRRFNFSSDDEITVFHAIGWVPFMEDKESYHKNLLRIKNELGPRILDATIAALQPISALISTAMTDGYADDGIIDAANACGADLIVIGARGIKGFTAIALGSVSRSIAINAPFPVLIVRPQQWQSDSLRILFATDGSETAEATGRFLKALPLPEDAEIRVITVARPLLYDIPGEDLSPEVQKDIDKVTELQVRSSEQLIADVQRYLNAPLGLIKVGDPFSEIVDAASAMEVDLIAVGNRGLRGVKGMLGSVSRSILGRADCSVLIGR